MTNRQTAVVTCAVLALSLTACGSSRPASVKVKPQSVEMVVVDGIRCVIASGGWDGDSPAISCDWTSNP